MDNVLFHKTKIICDLFNKSTNKSLFIPPYSPQFNPIENVFAVIKNQFKYSFYEQLNTKHKICHILDNLVVNFNDFYKHAFRNNSLNTNIFI